MISKFSARYGAILQEMLAETAGSVIIKTDANGFIEEASPGLEKLGLRLADMLFKPHLADLTTSSHGEALRKFHRDVLGQCAAQRHIEFPVVDTEGAPAWYSLSLRPAPPGPRSSEGALGLLRSVEGRRTLERELASASMTDLATGLANGRAFRALLAQQGARDDQGAVVVFEIDRLSSLKLKFGHATIDDILWAFGRFLSNMFCAGEVLSRLDGDRFAVLIPGAECKTALQLANEALATFTEISRGAQRADTRLSASAGVAALAGSPDTVLIHAERALVVARALGGNRAEMRDELPPWKLRPTGS